MNNIENILSLVDRENSNHKRIIKGYVKEIVEILINESDTYLDAGLMLTHYDIPLSVRRLVISKVREELTDRALREKISRG